MDTVITQKRNLPLIATRETCSGKTYIVTGANTGLGYEAAKHLVSLGAACVILAVRNVEAGNKAKAEIEAATGALGVAEVWALDLCSYDSVKAFAKRGVDELSRIDGLIENAGIGATHRTVVEGHVATVTVNVLSTFLLAVLLLPKLSETARTSGGLAHLVVVSSRRAFDAGEDWRKIRDGPLVKMDAEDAPPRSIYPLSKLLEYMTVRHLARLLPLANTGVIINVVCPGFCATQLFRDAPESMQSQIQERRRLYGRTAEDGSRTLLHAVVAGQESHGKLLHSCEIGENDVPDWAKNDETGQEHTWGAVAKELEAAAPASVSRILQ
ncbi:hypothetical protein B0H63DRAFT_497444 [Podospora didyma]|uniref:Ketoreductase domain-containing protein n=1 Tax=Podospora didyma TaxID=330526 RepID=A0AAE0N4K0_9PEZI|nr:hypothetical protein B0H63DRAFT_497444 [Podospora didyma]